MAQVSIIIPVYNVEKYIAQCIESLQNQTLSDIEMIFVDDCSKDNSLRILKKYAAKDKRIKIIHLEKNAGQSNARNVGLKNAKGTYISFVDSDDYIAPDMLETLYKKAIKTDADMVITNIYLDFADTGEQQLFRDSLFYVFLSGRVFKAEEYPALISCIGVWDRIYKRSLITNNHLEFPVGLVYEDHLFTVEALVLAKKITVVNKGLYYYRKNGGESITDNEVKNDKYKFDYLEITRRIKSFLNSKEVYDIFCEEYLRYQFFYATIHQQNTRNFENFKKFFYELREIFTEKDYEVLNNLELSFFPRTYLECLEKDNLRKAYSVLKSKSYLGTSLRCLKKKKKM